MLLRTYRLGAQRIELERGLQPRIAPDGAHPLLVRYTVKGTESERQYRLSQKYGHGPGQMKLAAACCAAARIRALTPGGVDWPTQDEMRLRAEVATHEQAERQDGLTQAKALGEYAQNKRRAKKGRALNASTKADCIAMPEPGRPYKTGKRFYDDGLYPIAEWLLARLTSDDVRGVPAALLKRLTREAVYAMPVLFAGWRWHGTVVPGHPLGRDSAGGDQFVLAPAQGNCSPIPPERRGAWWRVSAIAPSSVAADCC